MLFCLGFFFFPTTKSSKGRGFQGVIDYDMTSAVLSFVFLSFFLHLKLKGRGFQGHRLLGTSSGGDEGDSQDRRQSGAGER